MKKISCVLGVVLAVAVAVVTMQAFAGASGVSDPTITVADFTPSGGSVFKDQVHASLDSLDTAVEATIDVLDAIAGGTQAVDGKYIVVGGNSTTGLMVQAASVTSGTGTTQTVTFPTAYASAPIVQVTYTEDPGDVRPLFVTSITASNCVVNITADKNFAWTAVGARP